MSSSESTPAAEDRGVVAPGLSGFVFSLFFVFGGITSLNDVLIPKLKGLFSLSYAEAMLVQSAFFIGYLLVSIPAGSMVARLGYLRSASIGLITMALGCLLFLPAAHAAAFGAFLGALFVVAAGITIVQVVSNPLISLLGPPATASSRLTFAQAFNSLGTTVFPYVGSALILGSIATVDPATLKGAALGAFRAAEASVISNAYLGLAIALVILAGIVWLQRHRLTERGEAVSIVAALDLLKRPRFAFGMLCIFLYVGAEVSIGSLIVSYLEQANTLGLSQEAAGKHLVYYWGGAMVGRFIGAGVLRLFSPGKMLAAYAVVVLLLLGVSATGTGGVAGWSLLAIGLFNSIMFPTIFSLANEKLGHRTAEGSGLICTAIFGGAVIPPLTGIAADHVGLAVALAIPAVCYAIIAGFGWYARNPAPPLEA
jgi:FHS family L-fucose permease-like MFS transporter